MAKGRKKKKGISWQTQILLIFVLMAAIAAMPTTMLVFFGMLPTFVALFIDRTGEKTRVLTVGAMNAAGCTPFILQLWTTNNSMDHAGFIITDPRTIIVMYCAAGVGYIIDWAISGLVGTVMVQRANGRREQIAKHQAEMVERWGVEVTGEIPVDAYGFPLAPDDHPMTGKKAAKTAEKPR
jgi:hypothetical protein